MFPLWTGSQIGGIATYDTELLPALARLAPRDEFHVYSPSRDAIRRLRVASGNVTHHLLFPRSRWINVPISFPLATAFSRADLLHMTHVPPPISAKRYIMTLHCFSTFLHQEFYPRALALRINALVRRGLKSARLVVCVSNGLKEIAERELKIEPARLAVAYNGVSSVFRPVPRDEAAARVKQRYGVDRPYLLFVGVIAPRKNVARIVDAYALFRRETRAPLKLVLAGRKWIGDDVDRAVRRHRLETDVVHVDHVDHAQLPDLYSAAELLVFPSLWESFGMPVVEAMACGTPVLTSNGSCLPEIAGDAALCVDPYSVGAIAEGIAAIVGNAEHAERMRRRGLAQAAAFSWERSATQTLLAYRRALAA
jgi:glycosyltransferase involved in cell wall biosynthesis